MHHLMAPLTLLLLLASDICAQMNETEMTVAENSTEIVTTMEIDTENTTETVSTEESSPENTKETVSTEESSPENATETVSTEESSPENATETISIEESSPENATEAVSTEESSQATSSNSTLKLEQIDDGKCGQHEVWKECSGCESSCEQMKVICDDTCGEPKCQCDVGYFRYAPRKCITYIECKNGLIEL